MALLYKKVLTSSFSPVSYILHRSSLNLIITSSFIVIIPAPNDRSILFAQHRAVLLFPPQNSCLQVIKQNISRAFSVFVLYDNSISFTPLITSFFSGIGGIKSVPDIPTRPLLNTPHSSDSFLDMNELIYIIYSRLKLLSKVFNMYFQASRIFKTAVMSSKDTPETFIPSKIVFV